MNEQETRHGDAATRRRGDKKHDDNEDAQALPVSASPCPRVPASVPASVPTSQWRLFYAIELSPEVRARAAEHMASLRSQLPRVRAGWERTEKLHITLKFFGDVEETRTDALSRAAESAAIAIAPFTLTIADAGAFPLHGQPRVLWLGIRDSSGTLARLQQSLENECAAEGFKREERPFHPHLTIARLRQPAGARQLATLHLETGFPAMEMPINELVLMRSELSPNGSLYTALSRHKIARV